MFSNLYEIHKLPQRFENFNPTIEKKKVLDILSKIPDKIKPCLPTDLKKNINNIVSNYLKRDFTKEISDDLEIMRNHNSLISEYNKSVSLYYHTDEYIKNKEYKVIFKLKYGIEWTLHLIDYRIFNC